MNGATRLFQLYRDRMFGKSLQIAAFLEQRMVLLLLLWLLFTVPAGLLKIATTPTPIHKLADAAPILLAYSAVILSPVLGYIIGKSAFVRPATRRQPEFRWAVYGKWKSVDEGEARAHPDYGPFGFLISLIVGILLNVVVRTGEFFIAVPAIGVHAPDWGLALFVLMSLDVTIAGFLYMATFAMAMSSVPLFPRMLLFTWMMDIFMQLIIANQLSQVGNIPVAIVEPLKDLLQGNVLKVLISIFVWLPYLLLSRRVNVTYRHRLSVRPPDGKGPSDRS